MVVKIAPGPRWGMDDEGINWLNAILMMAWARTVGTRGMGSLGSCFWYAVAFTRADFMRVLLLDVEFRVAFGI